MYKFFFYLAFTILPFLAQAQNYPFAQKWENVEYNMKEGKLKSLTPLLNEIYDAAKKENNTAYVIKALLVKSGLDIQTSDNNDIVLETQERILQEIATTEGADKSILQSILAELYFKYYTENYYRIINRTDLNISTSNDFRTWDAARFLEEIDVLLQQSIEPKNLLAQTPVKNLEILLEGDKKWRYLRPSVFDLLANRALNMYQNYFFNEQNFNQAQKESQIKKIYHTLIDIHKNDEVPSALIEVELHKIKYDFKEQPTSEAYRVALEKLFDKYSKKEWATNILYEIALTYTNQEEEDNDYVQAITLCDKAIKTFPNSDGTAKCLYLKDQINTPKLSFETDGSFWANNYNPLYITHRNTHKIYYRIYRNSFSDLTKYYDPYHPDYIKKGFFTKQEIFKEGVIDLKKFSDHKTHSTKIPFEPLKPGNYLLILSGDPAFRGVKGHDMFQAHIVATSIELSSRGRDGAGPTHQLVDKANGLPLKNAAIEIYQSQTNNPFKKIKSLKTDNWGRFNFSINNRGRHSSFLIKPVQEEVYFPLEHYYTNHIIQDSTWEEESAFFTDRSIYRPGQTVYYKTILYAIKDNNKKVKPNQKVTITLRDVNGEEVSKKALTSNEFGSVHGEFILPNSGITGQYYIQEDWANRRQYIRVEEYKRPKFEVKLDSLKGIYRLNDKINVSGKATMFSGANVSDAKVVYRVYRQTYNPYRYWWRPYQPEPEVEMTQGETTTDANGIFQFDFKALPSQSNKKSRAYLYKIVADVVDISGETHTTENSVYIGDIPFTINLEAPESIAAKDFKTVKIKTTNLNGAKTKMQGRIEITEILPLDRVLRDQQREVDYELISKATSVEKMPYIAYNNEHLINNRKRGHTVLDKNWNTAKSEKIEWSRHIKPGLYEVKVTSTHKKDTIESVQIVNVTGSKDYKNNSYFTIQLNQENYAPGDQAEILITSDAKDAHAIVELEVDGEIVDKKIVDLNKKSPYTFPIKETYRGNVYLHAYFNKFNETTSLVKTIEVPYSNKKLDITTSTFRNKLLPGQEETWELTIKDNKGDKVLAELLAGMYDKSLDQFATNQWAFTPYSAKYSHIYQWETKHNTYFINYLNLYTEPYFPDVVYERLDLMGLNLNDNARFYDYRRKMTNAEYKEMPSVSVSDAMEEHAVASITEPLTPESPMPNTLQEEDNLEHIVARKNLEETAFFFPNLKTDKDGNVKISFTTPESLTSWNLQAIAHTQDLKVGTFQSDVITQKELMVVPNAPRFLREGDELTFKTKIINLSNKNLEGSVKLELLDAFTMQPIADKFKLNNVQQSFAVKSGGNTTAAWTLSIPQVDEVPSVVYRVIAAADNFSDGEESALPILTNRTLVTETMPMNVRENQTKTFRLDKLQNTQSASRDNFKLTMEMTTNPIWYAVMALPYLREFPYECSEQLFARFYANIISQNIVNANPKIKAVFDDWKQKDQLISPLEKNQELKNILLEESPWVRSAQTDAEQMKRMTLLFDLNFMRQELNDNYRKLEQKQSSSGGFPWFEGGRDNYYITAHIIAGFGHLEKMNIPIEEDLKVDTQEMLTKAIGYIDQEIENRWDKYQTDNEMFSLNKYDGLYWLYVRSFHLETNPLSTKLQKAKNYFLTTLEQDKYKENIHVQAILSLVLNRYGKTEDAQDLIFAIKDRAVESEEMGMYWKENVSGYGWHEAPVETQAKLIEAFDEITPQDVQSVESMKVWLLKNKQNNQWNSTKATTEAVYALMNTGKDWTNAEDGITIKVGNEVWFSKDIKPSQDIQSGSGYVKESWNKAEIKPNMGTVQIEKTSPGVAWGAMYWQYFEDLDKITSANTNVKFRKQLFIQRNTDQGPTLFEITANTPIKVGDLVKVRLEIQTDRAMEFVHIKDMRASGFEPVNVLSQYKWQDGLGYYESTRDAATNFFIDYMPKGIYVFEYDLRANNAGTFSNGITQLQNMYAPEFSAHSKGIKVEIE